MLKQGFRGCAIRPVYEYRSVVLALACSDFQAADARAMAARKGLV
jgi:hypothetical protein